MTIFSRYLTLSAVFTNFSYFLGRFKNTLREMKCGDSIQSAFFTDIFLVYNYEYLFFVRNDFQFGRGLSFSAHPFRVRLFTGHIPLSARSDGPLSNPTTHKYDSSTNRKPGYQQKSYYTRFVAFLKLMLHVTLTIMPISLIFPPLRLFRNAENLAKNRFMYCISYT